MGRFRRVGFGQVPTLSNGQSLSNGHNGRVTDTFTVMREKTLHAIAHNNVHLIDLDAPTVQEI